MTNSNSSINKSIAKGAVWMVLMRFCIKAIAMVSTMILARLLMPADFGIMALASSIYALVELLRAFGFDTVLIQKQNAGRSHYDTAWTLQILFSLAASALLIAISRMAADYYHDARLVDVLNVMAIIILVNGFNNIGVVEFRKKLNFNKEFIYQVLIKLSGFCVTIPLAWYWRSYWALLAGMLSANIVSLILGYVMQSFRPSVTLKDWRDVLGFSAWLFFNNILYFLNQHAQNFILGKFGGSSALGLFAVSNEVATLTTTEIVASINRAAYPSYAKVAMDNEKLKSSYIAVYSHIVLIALPSAVGIAAMAPLFVPVLLGEKWLDAVEVIQIIAIASTMAALNTNANYIYLAQAKQKITTFLMLCWLGIFIPLLLILVPIKDKEVLGVAYAALISSAVMFPINQSLLKIQLNLLWRELAAILYRPFIASAIMGTVVYQSVLAIDRQTLNIEGVFWLLLFITLGVMVFSLILLLLWLLVGRPNGVERDFIDKIRYRN